MFEGSAKRGPNRDGTYYDEVNIAPYLVEGENSIAALTWYWGKSGFSHRSSGKGGFFFSAQLDDIPLVSDATWKTIDHPAYSKEPTADPQTNYRLSEDNINYFAANNSIEGWKTKDYQCGQEWQAAVEKGNAEGSNWGELRKNPLPFWKLTDLLDYENKSDLAT